MVGASGAGVGGGYPGDGSTGTGALEQIQHAEMHKEEGNRYYGEGSYKKALGAYHKVFCYLNGLQAPPADIRGSPSATGSTHIPKDRVQSVDKLKQSCRLNMAACYLKLGEHQKCVDACGKALALGDSVKAYFRRAQAHLELRNFGGAKGDLERARALAGPDDAAIVAELRKVKAAQSQGGSKEERRQAEKMLAGALADPRVAESEAAAAGHSGPLFEELPDDAAADMANAAAPSASLAPAASAPPAAPAAPAASPASALDTLARAADTPTPGRGAGGSVVNPLNAGECRDEASKPAMALRELTYAWQQTEEDIKIYISFDQSGELRDGVDESRVEVEYGEWSVLLVIRPPLGAAPGQTPLGLRLGDFHRRVAPELCKCTVRSSRITLRLVKRAKEHWWNFLQNVPLHASS